MKFKGGSFVLVLVWGLFVMQASAEFTAYNDCIYSEEDDYIGGNVTIYGIGDGYAGPTSGSLLDKDAGDDTGVTVTLTQSDGVIWNPTGSGVGADCYSGTDASNTFGQIANMIGVIYYGDTGWWVKLTFTGLDPDQEYTFATSSNRDNSSYNDRWTRYTIEDADSVTNASSSGVTVNSESSVSFCTGYNTANGYVARWTNISSGADGDFTVKAEADGSQGEDQKAYSFDVFMLHGSGLNNEAPTVYAGVDRTTVLRTELADVALTMAATVTDDDLPDPPNIILLWTEISKPIGASVQFDSNTIEDPRVTLDTLGIYVLKLEATDGSLSNSDAVTITVIEPNCPLGDIDGNCLVDILDLEIFAGGWLDSSGSIADLGGSVIVDLVDYSLLAGNWLTGWGELRIAIDPQEAVDNGNAEWSIDGGTTWRASGTTLTALPEGTYTVSFKAIPDWYEPSDESVTVTYDQPAEYTGVYQRHTGSLQVTISPPAALPDAKWRRMGQTQWLGSGTTESNVPVGPYGVEFLSIAGWLAPASRDVVIAQNALSTVYVTYTELPDITLQINEFMAANSSVTGITDEQGDSDDWIEIYNTTDFAIDLGGMYIADDQEIWQIPMGYSSQTTVLSKGYLVLWADNEEETEGPLHVGFQLDADGDEITLYDTDGVTIVDSIIFDSQAWNISYGRYPNGEDDWYFFDVPTPAAENLNTGVANRVADTNFDPDRGFYDTPFEVTITTATAGATIYFTTDCSAPIDSNGSPTAAAETYNEATNKPSITTTTCLRAAAVKLDHLSTNIDTQTYIFRNDVLGQATNPGTGAQVVPAGYPTIWPGGSTTGDVTGDYQVDPDIVNHADSTNRLTTDRLGSIPTVCMVMAADDWFDDGNGLYVTEALDGTEYPGSFEYFDPEGDGRSIQQNVAIVMAGGVSGGGTSLNRWKSYKLSMRPRFKTQTDNGTVTGGGPKLREQIFPDSPVNDFDSIVLDAVLNNSWTHTTSSSQRENCMLIQDQYVADLHNEMGGYSPHGGYAHMYINGLYWGMYYIHERPDHSWAAEMFGGSKDEYDAIKHNEDLVINSGLGGAGATANFNTMTSAADAVGNDPSDQAKWETLEQYLDVDSFIDYLLANWFVGNSDWPAKNWYATHRVPDGKWLFHSWDAEHVLYTGDKIGNSPSGIHGDLDNCPEYRLRCADRIYKHFQNSGALSYPRTAEMYQARMNQVDQAIRGESARWGDNSPDTPYTYENWLNTQNDLLTGYFPGRSNTVFGWLDDTALYPNTDPPVFRINGSLQYGGLVSNGDALTLTNPNGSGTIYYTLDNSDPREYWTGNAVGSTYSSAISLGRSVRVKARVWSGSEWSALSEAVFGLPEVAENLRITELMYHPADPNAEFIELQNIGATTINLNLVSFTNGVDFTFGVTTLEPNAYVLVVQNQTVFDAKYGTALNVAGQYVGSLDNGGEEIDLDDALDTEIHDFDYKDGWYDITDGDGFSLTIKDPTAADPNLWDDKAGWRPSALPGGSPGTDDSGQIPALGSVVINEILAHSDFYPNDWIELHNTTGATINIGGWFLSDNNNDDPNYMKYRIADGVSIPANGYVAFTQDDNFGLLSSDSGKNEAFALSENGETVYLRSGAEAAGNYYLTGYYEQEDFGASTAEVAFGRYIKSAASGYDDDFVAMSTNTRGVANSYPKVGPIIISEIMYNPPAGGSYDHDEYEYIELYNISGSTVVLQEWDAVEGEYVPWAFTNGVDYIFPLGTSISAGQKIVVVKNTAAFSARYPSVNASKIYGPFENDSRLSNGGEKVDLGEPGEKKADGITYNYIRVDRVEYGDGSHPEDFPDLGSDPWPTAPDGTGPSLHQKTPMTVGQNYGNDVANWQSATGNPGS